MEGLAERRAELGALIAYQGAQQYDKDAKRYRAWLVEATSIAEQIAAGSPTPLQADRYAKMLNQAFLGGVTAGVSYWAALANQMSALEDAEQDVAEQTSWLIKWWAVPASLAAVEIAEAWDVQELAEDYAKWKTDVTEKAERLLEQGAKVAGVLLLGVALWFGAPLLLPLLAAGGRD